MTTWGPENKKGTRDFETPGYITVTMKTVMPNIQMISHAYWISCIQEKLQNAYKASTVGWFG